MNNKDINQENKKRMFTIGYEVPGHSKDLICISDTKSLMDADFLLISPEGTYSNPLFEKEINEFLEYGKTIFVFLSKEAEVSEEADGYWVVDNNYSFLPINIGYVNIGHRRPYKFFWKLY